MARGGIVYVEDVQRSRTSLTAGSGGWAAMFISPDEHIDTLHKMARRIGVRRQRYVDDTFVPHYTLTAAERVRALRAGADGCGVYTLATIFRAWVSLRWERTLRARSRPLVPDCRIPQRQLGLRL